MLRLPFLLSAVEFSILIHQERIRQIEGFNDSQTSGSIAQTTNHVKDIVTIGGPVVDEKLGCPVVIGGGSLPWMSTNLVMHLLQPTNKYPHFIWPSRCGIYWQGVREKPHCNVEIDLCEHVAGSSKVATGL